MLLIFNEHALSKNVAWSKRKHNVLHWQTQRAAMAIITCCVYKHNVRHQQKGEPSSSSPFIYRPSLSLLSDSNPILTFKWLGSLFV